MKKTSLPQTQTEWEEEMSRKILRFTQDELYMELRFMGIALTALTPKADKRLTTFATDGTMLFFSSEQSIRLFKSNPFYLNRLYLHTVLHCIFPICGSVADVTVFCGGLHVISLWNIRSIIWKKSVPSVLSAGQDKEYIQHFWKKR